MTTTGQPDSPWRKQAQTAAEATLVIACTLAFTASLIGVFLLIFTWGSPGHHDAVSFWAAGHQIDLSRNPYDATSILKLETTVGFANRQIALIARNPPPALCLMMPIGLLAVKPAAVLWLCMLLSALILSVHLLWGMHGRPANKLHFFGYSFGPAISCILVGQTAIFSLLGLVLFLRLHRSHPFAAGLSLWLCALKPHLFLPFGAALLVWMVLHRAYKLLAGSLIALALSSWVAWHLDPAIWTQYSQMMHSAGLENEFIPCFGVLFRFALHRHAMWLQYVPAALASAWAIGFYWMRRDTWDWQTDGALLMLVSLLCSPYAWMTDQSVLLPAVLLGVYRTSTRAQLYIPALVSAFIEIVPLLGVGMHSAWYLCTPPVLLAWFLYVSVQARATKPENAGLERDAFAHALPA